MLKFIKNKKFFVILISLLLVISLSIFTIILLWQKKTLTELKNTLALAQGNIYVDTLHALNRSVIDDTNNWQEYHNEKHGFSFRYPKYFKISQEEERRSLNRLFDFDTYNLQYFGDLVVTLVGEYQGAQATVKITLLHNFNELGQNQYVRINNGQKVYDFTDREEITNGEDIIDQRMSMSGTDNISVPDRTITANSDDTKSFNNNDLVISSPAVWSYHRPWIKVIKGKLFNGNQSADVIITVSFDKQPNCSGKIYQSDQEYYDCLNSTAIKIDELLFPFTPEKVSGDEYHRENFLWRLTGMPPELRYYPILMDQFLILTTSSYTPNDKYINDLIEEYFAFKSSKCRHYNEWKHHGVAVCQKFAEVNNSKLFDFVDWQQVVFLNNETMDTISQLAKDDIARLINTFLIKNKQLRIAGNIYPLMVDNKYKYVVLISSDGIDLIDQIGEAKKVFPTGKNAAKGCAFAINPEDNESKDKQIVFVSTCEGEDIIGEKVIKYRYNIQSDSLDIVTK